VTIGIALKDNSASEIQESQIQSPAPMQKRPTNLRFIPGNPRISRKWILPVLLSFKKLVLS
jgi:hypothetical protein